MLYSRFRMEFYSLYLHIPFCRHRCSYCDFNTYAGLESLIPGYLEGLSWEARLLRESTGERLPIRTVFFGGGTPSLLPAEGLERVLQALDESFDLSEVRELTLEANPGTLSLEYLQDLRSLGVDRLSLGMQSATQEELGLLERQHDFSDVIQAVSWSRRAGFANLSLDLIFGLPYQSLEDWKYNLDMALDLSPDHLSLYSLTLEQGTPMAHWVARGLLDEPEPDLAAEMYEWATERLSRAGYVQYEISNWARRENKGNLIACQHNLQYWRNLPYLGLGAGAHGYANGVRTVNVLAPAAYLQRLKKAWDKAAGEYPPFPVTPATMNAHPVGRLDEIGETMMMGLRLTREGVSDVVFRSRFGESLDEVFGEEIRELVALHLLERAGPQGDILRLTEQGRLLGNQVFSRFI
jgi:oxygen-independent coproporphyrinogen III oxidase